MDEDGLAGLELRGLDQPLPCGQGRQRNRGRLFKARLARLRGNFAFFDQRVLRVSAATPEVHVGEDFIAFLETGRARPALLHHTG
jgi:hypothetical protein